MAFDARGLPTPSDVIPCQSSAVKLAIIAARASIVTPADSPRTPAAQCFMNCLLDAQAASSQAGGA